MTEPEQPDLNEPAFALLDEHGEVIEVVRDADEIQAFHDAKDAAKQIFRSQPQPVPHKLWRGLAFAIPLGLLFWALLGLLIWWLVTVL
jgi:hypothetical protein